jgi:CRP/FNR family transcriptional regulator, anaerobic regulatory protein
MDIPEKEILESLQYSEYRQFSKGEYLLRAGEVCRFIGFLNKGLVVTIFTDATGREMASEFKHEGCFFTYTEGLADNKPSHKDFLALEDCEALMMKKEDLARVFTLYPKFETLFNQILSEELRQVLLNDQARKTQSAEERYLSLETIIPGAFQRIPIKYIAGYLGMEAPSLSRLRRRLAGR